MKVVQILHVMTATKAAMSAFAAEAFLVSTPPVDRALPRATLPLFGMIATDLKMKSFKFF